MAGTSGCIPDYCVNFFGQLREPARRMSVLSTPNERPHFDIEAQAKNAPVTSRIADPAPAPDRVTQLFKEYQTLVRALSSENGESHLPAVGKIFVEIQKCRREARREQARRHLAETHKAKQHNKNQDESPDQAQITNDDQHPNQEQGEQEAENGHRHQEQHHLQQLCQCSEYVPAQYEEQHQPRLRSQSFIKHPSHRFIITHYPPNEDEATQNRQSGPERDEDVICGIERASVIECAAHGQPYRRSVGEVLDGAG